MPSSSDPQHLTAIAPAATLEAATGALDFTQPLNADDPRWVDLSPARGDQARVILAKKLKRSTSGQFKHIAFTSHRGAGKSTELLHLRDDLGSQFSCLYLVANVEMDAQRIEREDLLLILAQGVEQYMRDQKLPLDAELLDRIAHWFSEITQTQSWLDKADLSLEAGVEAKAEIPFFSKLFLGFKSLLKLESEKRDEVKRTLRQYPGTLLSSLNQVLDDANKKLRDAGRGELLIVIDNLDRYHPKDIDDLLVKGGDQIRKLRCHVVVTPPISLQYRPETAKLSNYFDVSVMHAPRLRRAEQPYDQFDGPGLTLFQEVLAKRIDLATLMPDVNAQRRLIGATGGAIRNLLRYTHEASLLPDAAPITLANVTTVLERERAELRDLINVNGWAEPLAQVMNTKQLISHDACLDLLHHQLVLKYNSTTWYDVHPLIAEIPEVRGLRNPLSQKPLPPKSRPR